MRWGLNDLGDDVLPVNGLDGPVTAKTNTRPRLRLVPVPGDREAVGWKLVSASLKDLTGVVTYWTMGETPYVPVSETFELLAMRPHIEHAKLYVSVDVLYKDDDPGGGTNRGDSGLRNGGGTDVFTVVAAPLAPMDKPWASFMPYVCKWGHGESTVDGAARALTFGLFFQRPGLAYPANTASYLAYSQSKVLFLKRLIDRWATGFYHSANCLDVSAVLSVAHASVGVDSVMCQFVGTPLFPPGHLHENTFESNPICVIGRDPAVDDPLIGPPWFWRPWFWAWHSMVFVADDFSMLPSGPGRLFDACAASKEDLAGQGYRNPPAWHPSGNADLWRFTGYWYTGTRLGLVARPAQSPPISLYNVLLGRPLLTTAP